ncbi:MAG: hypothetical protein RSA66_09495 [Muribaculaceae bacterium]
MYRLTSDVTIGNTHVKPTEVSWKSGVSSLTDTCTIKLARRRYIKDCQSTSYAAAADKFRIGDAVTVKLGYNGANVTRFEGFVERIIAGNPLTLECTGWAYKLRDIYFTRSYKATTLHAILTDLVAGSGIVISPKVPHVALKNVTFKDAPAQKVLEWVQKELLCVTSFYGNVLYAGILKYGVAGKKVALSLGWNTVSDDLKKIIMPLTKKVEIRFKSKNGSVKSYGNEMHKYDNIKSFNVRAGLDATYINALRAELEKREFVSGNQGGVTAFLEPAFAKGDTVQIIDKRYRVRAGLYFVDAVDGSYGVSGGRQKLTLKWMGDGANN